jgi:pimeloyl-ACP methyl ester carboxylesterase
MDDTPIVLIHGATSSPRIWQSVVQALGDGQRVLTPTLAGHLGGPPLQRGLGSVVERLAEDMCEQLDEAGVGSAHLVGNSLGGWVALELARRGRARSVLAFSPAGGWSRAVDLQRMLLIFRIGAVLRRSKVLPRVGADPRKRRILLRAMAEHADRLTASQTAAVFEDLAGCDALSMLIAGARANGPIKALSANCPVRIAWGTQDRTLPFARYGRPLVAAITGAEVQMMADVGHVPMIDDPAAVATAILRFVDDVAV